MTFADKLKALRNAKGLSEAKLAKESGLALGTLHTYGLGSRTPSFPAVVKLAAALGVDCTAFADCEDMKAADDKPAAKKARGKRGGK